MKLLPIRNPGACRSPAALFLKCLAWILLLAGLFFACYSASAIPSANSTILWLAGMGGQGFEWAVAVVILIPTVLTFAILLCLSELFENTARIARCLEGFTLESSPPDPAGTEPSEKAEEGAA